MRSTTVLLVLIFSAFSVLAFGKANEMYNKEIITKAKTGDLVFRFGTGFWSEHFRNVSQKEKRFSHVGIIIKEKDRIFVVHASASDVTGIGRVKKVSLSEFIENTKEVAIYRLSDLEGKEYKIENKIRNYMGRQFDASFDLKNDDKVYCSELVRVIYNNVLGKVVIPTTKINGYEVVAIDDCYLYGNVIRVFDNRM